MSRRDFDRYVKEHAARKDANPPPPTRAISRRAASAKDPSVTAQRPLLLLRPLYGAVEGRTYESQSHQFLDDCRAWGLPVDLQTKLCRSFDDALRLCRAFEKNRTFGLRRRRGRCQDRPDPAPVPVGFTFRSPRLAVVQIPRRPALTQVRGVEMSVGRTAP